MLDAAGGPIRRFVASRWLRVPMLQHEEALVVNTTLFREENYKARLGVLPLEDYWLESPQTVAQGESYP
jgi:hypothetical protein